MTLCAATPQWLRCKLRYLWNYAGTLFAVLLGRICWPVIAKVFHDPLFSLLLSLQWLISFFNCKLISTGVWLRLKWINLRVKQPPDSLDYSFPPRWPQSEALIVSLCSSSVSGAVFVESTDRWRRSINCCSYSCPETDGACCTGLYWKIACHGPIRRSVFSGSVVDRELWHFVAVRTDENIKSNTT